MSTKEYTLCVNWSSLALTLLWLAIYHSVTALIGVEIDTGQSTGNSWSWTQSVARLETFVGWWWVAIVSTSHGTIGTQDTTETSVCSSWIALLATTLHSIWTVALWRTGSIFDWQDCSTAARFLRVEENVQGSNYSETDGTRWRCTRYGLCHIERWCWSRGYERGCTECCSMEWRLIVPYDSRLWPGIVINDLINWQSDWLWTNWRGAGWEFQGGRCDCGIGRYGTQVESEVTFARNLIVTNDNRWGWT